MYRVKAAKRYSVAYDEVTEESFNYIESTGRSVDYRCKDLIEILKQGPVSPVDAPKYKRNVLNICISNPGWFSHNLSNLCVKALSNLPLYCFIYARKFYPEEEQSKIVKQQVQKVIKFIEDRG